MKKKKKLQSSFSPAKTSKDLSPSYLLHLFNLPPSWLKTLVKNTSKKPDRFFSSVSSVTQSCPTLCNPMGYSLPGSSLHGIFRARILKYVALSSSRGSSQPRDWTHLSCVSCTAGRFFTAESLGKHLQTMPDLKSTCTSWHCLRTSQLYCPWWQVWSSLTYAARPTTWMGLVSFWVAKGIDTKKQVCLGR